MLDLRDTDRNTFSFVCRSSPDDTVGEAFCCVPTLSASLFVEDVISHFDATRQTLSASFFVEGDFSEVDG
jgi:hypothetical protein